MKRKNLWRGLCALLTLVMLLSGAAAFGQPASAAGEELTLEQLKELLKGEADMTVAEYAEKMKEHGMEVDLTGMDPNASIWDYIQYAPEEKPLEEQMQETGKMTISPGTEHEAVVELPGFVKTTQEQLDGQSVTVYWVKPNSVCKVYTEQSNILFALLSEQRVTGGKVEKGAFRHVQLLEEGKLGLLASTLNWPVFTADAPGQFVFGVNPEEVLVQSYLQPDQSSLTLRSGYYYTLSVTSVSSPAAGGTTVWLAIDDGSGTQPQQPEESTAFSDVPQSKWYYETITKMTQRGLFTGVGNGLFAPEKTMTRAEFMAVITRLLFQEELDAMPAPQGQPWWAKNYELAVQYGLLTEGELENGQLDRPITRQEMTMLCVRACTLQDEQAEALIPASAIADYDEIDPLYSTYVRQAYALGLVGGVNDQGAFAPEKTLTRAEGCTVLCRLVYPEDRLAV